MASEAKAMHPPEPVRLATRAFARRWSAAAWGSTVLGVLFVAVSCWWLSRDRGIPVFDAGLHLGYALSAYEDLDSWHLLKVFTESSPYPPLTYLVGALGIFVGGVDAAPAIVAQNLVFVALLTLGCYKVARLAFNPLAGLLAVVFALGSPLIIEEFHEFMLDAPEAAMVAIATWAILATERFSRLGVCALAGAAVGLGMLSKETFAYFVAGVVLVSALRGGRHAWRGFALFAGVAFAISLPWYLYELTTVNSLAHEALGPSGSQHLGIAPPRLSGANLEWYFWSALNWQLFLPLFAFAAVGWVWTLVGFVRRRPVSGFAPELALGSFLAWAALTETYVHDVRYGIPLTLYLAVFAAGWISRLPAPARVAAATALVLVALANTLGVGFGVASTLASAPSDARFEQQPDRLVYYSNYGLWIGGPTRDGDVLGLLRALRRDGVRHVTWASSDELESNFSYQGITVLARIAGLSVPAQPVDPARVGARYAFLRLEDPEAGFARPCTMLSNGAGVWVRLGGSSGAKAWNYCSLRSG